MPIALVCMIISLILASSAGLPEPSVLIEGTKFQRKASVFEFSFFF